MHRQADSRFQAIYEHHLQDVTLYIRRRVAADAVEGTGTSAVSTS